MYNTNMQDNRPLRVGFDLDGVLLYNPARIIRPIIAVIKNTFIKNRRKKFIIPKTRLQKFIWSILHLSSMFIAMFIAPGLKDIHKLVKEGKIEAYIITARYSFLKYDFEHWKKKLGTKEYFTACYQNEKDEQPHLFKERMIRELDLDIFVEDNWDIVEHLDKKAKEDKKHHRRIYWVYNILDRNIEYHHKVPVLQEAMKDIIKTHNF
jgi:hypothetical protein